MARSAEVRGAYVRIRRPWCSFFLTIALYAQHHLNRIWEHELERHGQVRLGMRGYAPAA